MPTDRRESCPCRGRLLLAEPLEGRRLLSAGDLDPTWGNGGVVGPELPSGLFLNGAEPIDTRNGRTVFATTLVSSSGTGSTRTLVRLDDRGRLDPTFGEGGQAIVPPLVGSADLLILPDNKILMVGGTHISRLN